MYFVYLLDEDTIRYLVSQTVDGEQDSGIVLADYGIVLAD